MKVFLSIVLQNILKDAIFGIVTAKYKPALRRVFLWADKSSAEGKTFAFFIVHMHGTAGDKVAGEDALCQRVF